MHKESADEILRILEEAHRRISYDLYYFPGEKTLVSLYSRGQFQEVTQAAEWITGLYDGKIRIPLREVRQNPKKSRLLLFHEYTHVILHLMTRGNCPTWLHEGLAQHYEVLALPGKKKGKVRRARILRKAFGAGRLFSLKDLEAGFLHLGNQERVKLAYLESRSVTEYLIARFGFWNVRRILLGLREGRDITRVIPEVLRLDYQELEEEWKRTLTTK